MEQSADYEVPTTARREPTQKRSRERVERILAVSTELIGEQGSDALRMSDVAQKAGISIGSLYQYFPDKGAIVTALAERIHAESRTCIAEGLENVTTLEDFHEAFAELIKIYYGMFLSEPVMRDVWSGMQADRNLRAVELAQSRINGELLASVLQRLRPSADSAVLGAKAFLVMQLGEATMRLAVSVPRDEGDRLVETYTRMALRELEAE
ncbi:TetR family transcriptional regulator [Mesorhizobium sp. SB112]|uniref:TetR/AcrR family transcriptional regulator n=1 Tax=Mesorhizobium sp. SB112 TaxID=3151853 RepID=UPI003267FA18